MTCHALNPSTFHRRGAVLVYSLIMMVALIAITSLAVDYGVVELAKTKITATVDGAARAGVLYLARFPEYSDSDRAQGAQSAAIAIAAQNTANFSTVALTTDNVLVGRWDTSSQTFTAGATPYNAVQVTANLTAAGGNPVKLYFASILGQNTCDVRASAVAMYTPANYGIVGLDYINMGGNTSDVYYNTTGTVDTSADTGSVASNGNISLSGNAHIYGDAHPGIGMTVTKPGNVSGSTTPLTSPLVYPNGSAGTFATSNDNANIDSSYTTANGTAISLSVAKNQTLTLPGGNYYLQNLSVTAGGTLSFSGPVTLYVTGTVYMHGNAVTTANLPANLQIIMAPDANGNAPGSADFGSTSALYAHIYAPQSPVTFSGTGDIYGTLIGKSIDMSGTADIHYDILSDPNAGRVLLVK